MKKFNYLVRSTIRLAFGVSLMVGQLAHADAPEVSFAGFASLVYAKNITDKDEGTDIVRIPDGGESRDFNKLGLRMHADMKNNLSFTAQMIAEGSNDYDPTFDWLFATYYITSEVSITAGKYRAPIFMYSDYLDTSYAYQWLAPPLTVYNANQTPFKSLEGLKLSYVTDMWDWTSELVVFGGKTKDDFSANAIIESQLILEDAVGIAWTVDREWLMLRAFYFEADSSVDISDNKFISDLLYDAYEGVEVANATGTAVGDIPHIGFVEELLSGIFPDDEINFRDELLWEDDPSKFYGLGAGLDFERFFMNAEITRIEVDTNIVVPTLDSFYVMAGVRLPGQVSLSLTYGEDKDRITKETYEQFDRYIGIDATLDSLLLVPYQEGIKQIVSSLQNYEVKTTMLTARWDFHRSAAFKFEYLHYDYSENKSESNTPQAIRLGVDLVF